MKTKVPELSITFGEGVVTVRRHGSTSAITANVLGRETIGGVVRVYLDRLVHRNGDMAHDWNIEGSVSTILVGSAVAPA